MTTKKISDLPDAVTAALTDLMELERGGTGYKLLLSALSALVPATGVTPGGRPTLIAGTPVMTSDQTAKSTVYYVASVHDQVPVWDGSKTALLSIGSPSAILDGTNHTSGHNYDLWGYSSSGTFALGFGPAWTSDTARGTGAGTTEWEWKGGVRTNKNSITLYNNGSPITIAANLATLLGTVRTTANGQTGCAFKPAAANGGSNTIIGLASAYNLVPVHAICQDNTASWTTTNGSWHTANTSNSNRISYVDCLGTESVYGVFRETDLDTTGGHVVGYWGMVQNSTSATPNVLNQMGTVATSMIVGTVEDFFMPSLGFNYIQEMEASGLNGSTTTFTGFQSPRQWNQLLIRFRH